MTAATPPIEAAPEPKKRGFRLPSAYTILFILIVVVAALTWIIPAGRYDYNDDGTPIPGTYHRVDQTPARIFIDSLTAPINGLYGIEGEDGSISYYNCGRAVRRDRRRAVHPRHRRVPRRHDADGRDPGGDRAGSSSASRAASGC